jgi:hypothetical protein
VGELRDRLRRAPWTKFVSGSGQQKQLARMTRGEISEDSTTWTLSASRTKNRRVANIRNDGVGGSNPSCGTNKINNLVARAQIRELSCPPCVRKIDAAQA